MAEKTIDPWVIKRYKKMSNWALILSIPAILIPSIISMFIFIGIGQPTDIGIYDINPESLLIIFLISIIINAILGGIAFLLGNRARRIMPMEFAPIKAWLAILISALSIVLIVIPLWIIKTILAETIRRRPHEEAMRSIYSIFR